MHFVGGLDVRRFFCDSIFVGFFVYSMTSPVVEIATASLATLLLNAF
jgi:hypothetical protein